MLPARVQLPTFLAERGIRRDALSRLPTELRDRLSQQVELVRRWVAEPAFQQPSGEAAVEFVERAVGPMAQLRSELVATIAATENGLDVLLGVGDDRAEAIQEDPLAGAADLVQRAQRSWLRFVAFHPDLEQLAHDPERGAEFTALSDAGFYADVFMTISMIAREREPPVEASILLALRHAARRHATSYYTSVRSILESLAPTVDAADPFKTVGLDALLALPPYEGPALESSAMDKALEDAFRSR